MIFKKKPAVAEGTEAVAPPASGKPRKRWVKWVVLAVVAALIAVFILRSCSAGKKAMEAMNTGSYLYSTVARQDITQSLTGTGALQPADSYDVTALVTGEILDAPFEEGDVLEEGALLYEIDPSDAENTIERAELSLERAQMSYNQTLENVDNLNVKATAAGTVVSLDVEVGDEVTANQPIGKLRDSSTMSLKAPFNAADAAEIAVGDPATVTVDGSFETINGTVSKIGGADEVLSGGMVVRYITIDIQNPGAVSGESTATAMVGQYACNSSGAFSYKSETDITAKVSGKVGSITVKEGGWVDKNGVILVLTSKDLDKTLRESELSLKDSELSFQNQREQLDDYHITSPISGTVILKNYKAGDNLTTSATGGKSLCVIYDLSYLTMTLNVDELDISSVSVGQKVQITADAVEGRVYEGEVTSISVQGTTANGVTVYPVTIRIDQTDGLLPGMNVDAEIVVASTSQVLAVPTGAVQRGNRVLVSTDSEAGKAALTAQGASSGESKDNTGLPEGYVYVEVTLGLSNDNFIEIKDGLAEGDAIAYTAPVSSGYQMMYGMTGGMVGGADMVVVGEGGGGGPMMGG